MTLSTRRARSPDQTAHVTSGCIGVIRPRRSGAPLPASGFSRGESFEHPALENLHLLLRILERPLAILQQLGAALVRRQGVRQRQLSVLHGRQDRFELGESGLKSLGK